ncbi:XRE family transcriptional regulator, partial [Streptomyces sp. SID5789]|nr:XRE family transcriptional regulator [Streptomyces sp. SID5789]
MSSSETGPADGAVAAVAPQLRELRRRAALTLEAA